MVRSTNAVASRRRRKRLLKQAKGFWGDRKNHIRITKEAVVRSLSENYRHRKLRKRDFRKLWISRVGIAAKIRQLSYCSFIDGLKRAKSELNRKMLSEIAIHDPQGFSVIAEHVKQNL